jgi:ribosomal protein L29
MVEKDKKLERKKEASKEDKKEIEGKMNELKIELLKQTQKRKGIKKEIARLLTLENQDKSAIKNSKEKKK